MKNNEVVKIKQELHNLTIRRLCVIGKIKLLEERKAEVNKEIEENQMELGEMNYLLKEAAR